MKAIEVANDVYGLSLLSGDYRNCWSAAIGIYRALWLTQALLDRSRPRETSRILQADLKSREIPSSPRWKVGHKV